MFTRVVLQSDLWQIYPKLRDEYIDLERLIVSLSVTNICKGWHSFLNEEEASEKRKQTSYF